MNPFSDALLQSLAHQHGTPLWVYDAATIRARIAELRAFDTIRFAQKANSNIHLLRLMREQGVVVDAVSRGEILRALAAGYTTDLNAQGASGITIPDAVRGDWSSLIYSNFGLYTSFNGALLTWSTLVGS